MSDDDHDFYQLSLTLTAGLYARLEALAQREGTTPEVMLARCFLTGLVAREATPPTAEPVRP